MKKDMYKHKTPKVLYPTLLLLVSGVPLIAGAADTSFIPLTSLPGIEVVAGAPSLPDLLNNLYRLCIGAAAVIAILQIMRAGVTIVRGSGGSTIVNKEAKELISNAIIGLVLVLSPYLVFSIINPSILDLNLDVSGLQSTMEHVELTPTILDTPEEAQNTDTRLESNVCLDPALLKQLQGNLDMHRKASSTQGAVNIEINSYGQAGAACCEAVKDVSGKSCTAGMNISYGRGDVGMVKKNYTCTCPG